MSVIYNSREPLRLANKYDLVNDEKSFHLALCPVKELPTLGGLECVMELNIKTDFHSKEVKQHLLKVT